MGPIAIDSTWYLIRRIHRIQRTQRIFFDTEFTGLTAYAKLISIGLVDESGEQTFYAELTDTWRPADAGEFALREVVPKLEGGDTLISMQALQDQLAAWIQAFASPVILATDSLQWDWPWVEAILGHHWSENLVREPLLLTMNYLSDFDAFEAAIDVAFASGLRRHQALDDALANRLGWIAAGGDTIGTCSFTSIPPPANTSLHGCAKPERLAEFGRRD